MTRALMMWILMPLMVVSPAAQAAVLIEGVEVEVVDAHLHTLESPGDFNLMGKATIIRQIPAFVAPYYSALSAQSASAYAPHLGIKDQMDWAGVDRAVLLAAYTQHTVGFSTNRFVSSVLRDSQNPSEDGVPRLLGLASINLDGFDVPEIRAHRLDALESHLASGDFIGIKLAHAHQAIQFDDPLYDGIYEVAARQSVAVLLHTGISPFPGTCSESEFTNPAGLESVIQRFDGTGVDGRVEFILSHIGTADAAATNESFALALSYDNVWLEVSALGQGMIRDENGQPSDESGPQHPRVMAEIKELGLIDRTLFASDGPQSSGKIKGYLAEIMASMREANFSVEEQARVLSGSFYECFNLPR